MNPPQIKDQSTGNFIWCHGPIQLIEDGGDIIQIPLHTLLNLVRNFAKEQVTRVSADDNYLQLKLVGATGVKYGCVVQDTIPITEITGEKINTVFNELLKELNELEIKHPLVTNATRL